MDFFFLCYYYFLAEAFIDYNSFGLLYEQINTTLFGDEENFLEPISQASFLEYIHTKIFFMMMILLTLSAVYIRLNTGSSKLFWLNMMMINALFMLLALALSYFTHSLFIYLYILTILSYGTLVLLYMVAILSMES
ncbi:MAG: hypothetical protein Q9M40_14205 [Sulfurimonas sp.]|nr:hypothetical protein [Sulfurimonas sp.]